LLPTEGTFVHRPIKAAALAIILLAGLVSCGSDNPVQPPPNRSPILSSLVAFPSVIGPGDSTIFIASATDPDGDPLVYDWLTDSRLIIKGNSPSNPELYNSPSPLQIFYYGAVSTYDSAWVECTTRDGKGGVAVKHIWIYTTH
jgi:hypothetical protein